MGNSTDLVGRASSWGSSQTGLDLQALGWDLWGLQRETTHLLEDVRHSVAVFIRAHKDHNVVGEFLHWEKHNDLDRW